MPLFVTPNQSPNAAYTDVLMPGVTKDNLKNETNVPLFLYPGTEELIENQINDFSNRADESYEDAKDAIDSLGRSWNYRIDNDYLSRPDWNFLSSIDYGSIPSPDINNENFTIDTGGLPVFDPITVSFNDYGLPPEDDTEQVNINLPDRPDALTAQPPPEPDINTDVNLPPDFDPILPPAPTFVSSNKINQRIDRK